jgi:hypothetical protein
MMSALWLPPRGSNVWSAEHVWSEYGRGAVVSLESDR